MINFHTNAGNNIAIYEDLRQLALIGKNSMNIYFNLMNAMKYGEGDILYISPTQEMAFDSFIKYCQDNKIKPSKIDMNNLIIRKKTNSIRFMSIEKIRAGLDGYRFVEIRFTF